ncbi:hypothetical protein Q5X52_15370 [Acinetobacter baumannii]|nr:hypothetical protein [Acinetobacter baumannii]
MKQVITVYRAVHSVNSDKAQMAIINAENRRPHLAHILVGERDPNMFMYESEETGLKIQTTKYINPQHSPKITEALIKAVSLISDGYANYYEGNEGDRFFNLTSCIHIDTLTNKLYYKDFTPA